MSAVIKLNDMPFDSKQNLEAFILSNDFIPFCKYAFAHPRKPLYVPEDSNIFVLQKETGSNDFVFGDLKVNPVNKTYYWSFTHTSPRKSGGDYFDATDEQKEWIDYFKSVAGIIDARMKLIS